MGNSKTTPNAARKAFVKGAGVFGKYLFRFLSYAIENGIAFLGLTATIAGLFLISGAFGITIPVIAAAAESAVATLAGMPLLAGTVALAAAIAAPETLKKIYKECTGWVVKAYKAAIKDLFVPEGFDANNGQLTKKTFNITEEELEAKRAKHPELATTKYATAESYNDAEQKKYAAIMKEKTADLELAGHAGKRKFKAAANGLADGFEWVAGAPAYLYSCLPSFNSCCSSRRDNEDNDNKLDEPLLSPGKNSKLSPKS